MTEPDQVLSHNTYLVTTRATLRKMDLQGQGPTTLFLALVVSQEVKSPHTPPTQPPTRLVSYHVEPAGDEEAGYAKVLVMYQGRVLIALDVQR